MMMQKRNPIRQSVVVWLMAVFIELFAVHAQATTVRSNAITGRVVKPIESVQEGVTGRVTTFVQVLDPIEFVQEGITRATGQMYEEQEKAIADIQDKLTPEEKTAFEEAGKQGIDKIMNSLNQEINGVITGLEDSIKKGQADIKALEERKAELEGKNAELEKKNGELKVEVVQLDRQVAELQARRADLVASIVALNNKRDISSIIAGVGVLAALVLCLGQIWKLKLEIGELKKKARGSRSAG